MLKHILTGSLICASIAAVGVSAQAQQPSRSQTPATQASPSAQPSPAASPAAPQTQVSQQEVEKFANAVKEIRQIQDQAQSQAQGVLQSQNLTVDRFNELLKSKQDPQSQPNTRATPQEQQNFDQALNKISQIQQDTRQRMEQAVTGQGLDVPRFNQILAQARDNPDLRQRVEQVLQTSQGGSGSTPSTPSTPSNRPSSPSTPSSRPSSPSGSGSSAPQ